MGSFVAADASSLTTSVTTLTGVTWPAHSASDVAIVAWASDNTQTRTEPPTGFTSLFTNADGSLRAIIGGKNSTGSESGDVSLVCGGANRQTGILALYRGYNPTVTNITSLAETSGSNVSSHSSPSITPSDSASAIVLIYMDRVSSAVVPSAPAGYAVRSSFTTGGTGGTTVVVADKLSGLTAGVAESPAAWTGATLSTTAYVIALELTPAITGTAAVTQAANTSIASGSVSSSGITGTAAVSQAADTSSATGILGYSGASAVTQAAQTSSGSGVLGYTGTVAKIQAANTSAASGAFSPAGISGSAAATQAGHTSSATGILGYTGTSARTQAANTSAATGSVLNPVAGTCHPTQAGQTASASGVLIYAAIASPVQAGDTASASGIFFVPVTGSAAVVQEAQTADASGISFDRITTRPDIGTTSRTAAGVTPRPLAGTTPRP